MVGTALTLAAMIPEIIKGGVGIAQLFKGNKFGKEERPVMSISPYDQEALNIQRMMAASGNMPGFNLAKENVDSTFSNAITQGMAAGNPNISQLYKNKTSALKDLALSNADFQTNQLSNLTNNLRTMGSLDRQVFDFNQAQPYQETMEAANRLKEGGAQNIFSAMSNISGGLIEQNSTDQILEMIKGTGTENIAGASGVTGDAGIVAKESESINQPLLDGLKNLSASELQKLFGSTMMQNLLKAKFK